MFFHSLFVIMDETADARSDWSRPVGRPYTSWMATLEERPISAQSYLRGCYKAGLG